MNNLSIALYAIEVLGNLNNLLVMTAVFSGCFLIVAFFFKFMSSDRSYPSEAKANDDATKAVKFLLPIFIVATLFGVTIPNKDTIRLIVASEFGETLYKSEDVQEMVNPAKKALKKWLNDYSKEAK